MIYRRIQRGFTLLEVLVALAILATALYATSGSARSAARAQTHRENAMLAHWVASNLATEISLTTAAPEETDDKPATREVPMYGRDFVATARPQRDADERLIAYAIEVAARAAPDIRLHRLMLPVATSTAHNAGGAAADTAP